MSHAIVLATAWWNDGLVSNLIAEATGFVGGTIVTLFGVSRLLEWREQHRLRPLRARFATRMERAVRLMAMTWATRLNMLSEGEIPAELPAQVLQTLPTFADGLAETLRAKQANVDETPVLTIARHTVELVHDISLAADRFSQLLAEDVRLVSEIEDVEQRANELALALKNESMMVTPEGEAALASLSADVLREAAELAAYVRSTLETQ